MCDVLDRVEARGKARGMVIGENRGMEKTRKEMILNMLKENISVDTIAREVARPLFCIPTSMETALVLAKSMPSSLPMAKPQL